jgi:hypothetical protein
MTFRNHTTTLLALATLNACAMAPAHADIAPVDAAVVGAVTEQLPPGDLLGYQPAPSVVADWPMDPPMPLPTAGPTLLASWRGADLAWNPPGLIGPGLGSAAGGNNNGGNLQTGGNGNGNNGCGNGNSGPNGEGCNRPDPPRPEPAVPGPLPVLGVGAMFRASRQLRRRIR